MSNLLNYLRLIHRAAIESNAVILLQNLNARSMDVLMAGETIDCVLAIALWHARARLRAALAVP